MRPRFKSCLITLALLLATLPCAAAEPAAVLRATLPNGLRVVIVPDPLAPVVTTQLTYRAGSNDAPDGFPGTAHALEHMMFRGSEGLDRDQLAELGALLGGIYNAHTEETLTQYTYTIPADDLRVALHVEALRMRGLSLNQADWDQERGAIEQEVSRDLSSPLYKYQSQVQAILFHGTPYEHDALGTRPSFDKTDAALLRQFYDRWYAPNNAILVIAGDVKPDQALAEVQSLFGEIPRHDVPDHALFTVRPIEKQTLALSTDFPAGLVTIAYRMPGLGDRDFAAADVLADVLGSERGALYGLVPAGRALMSQFAFHPKPDVGVGYAFAAFPAGGDPAPLLADLQRIIAATLRDGVSSELVTAAKRAELAQLAFQRDSISGLASAWSRAVTLREGGSPDDLARAYAAVTVADVNRLARQFLDPAHAVTAVLTPLISGKAVAGTGFGSPESFDNLPDHPVALPPWARSALANLTVPDDGPPPDVSVLPNGLRLIIQPEHVSHAVLVYGSVDQVSETQEPPGKDGVATVTAALFGYGTRTRNRLAFRAAIDDIAAEESAGASFYLRVLTPQFRRGMQLLAENELHPAFPPEAFAVVRAQIAQGLAGRLRSPGYMFRRAIDKAIVPEGDPTLREATPETVKDLQRADVKAFYAAAFRPDLTTIVVVGDITPQHARRVVAETFGLWRAVGPRPVVDLPPDRPNQPSEALVPDASSLQDSVALSESVSLPVTSPDRYTLMLGNAILGSGFSSRLYKDLRIRSGYVYSVDSNLYWTRTRARYTVEFGADPDKVDKARQMVLGNLRNMQTAPVTDTELSRAKALMMRRLQMLRTSVPAIASQYLRLVALGLPLDSPQIAARRYLEITAPQIQQAFGTWLRPDDLAEVVKGPAPSP